MPHLKALLCLISLLQSTVTAMIITIIIVNNNFYLSHSTREREGGKGEGEREIKQ